MTLVKRRGVAPFPEDPSGQSMVAAGHAPVERRLRMLVFDPAELKRPLTCPGVSDALPTHPARTPGHEETFDFP